MGACQRASRACAATHPCPTRGAHCADAVDRTQGEFEKEHYISAVNIPAFSLPGPTPLQAEFLAGLAAAVPEKDKKMVVACASGKRSGMCMPWIVAAGYTNAVDMEGGWGAW